MKHTNRNWTWVSKARPNKWCGLYVQLKRVTCNLRLIQVYSQMRESDAILIQIQWVQWPPSFTVRTEHAKEIQCIWIGIASTISQPRVDCESAFKCCQQEIETARELSRREQEQAWCKRAINTAHHVTECDKTKYLFHCAIITASWTSSWFMKKF